MTYDEFKRHVGKAGLTLKAFAALVGMTPSSLSNYALKIEVPHHLAIIAVLMGEMAEEGKDFLGPIMKLGVPKKKSRGGSRPIDIEQGEKPRPRTRRGPGPQTGTEIDAGIDAGQAERSRPRTRRAVPAQSRIGNDVAAPSSPTRQRTRPGPARKGGSSTEIGGGQDERSGSGTRNPIQPKSKTGNDVEAPSSSTRRRTLPGPGRKGGGVG
jgi:hypothetical protein